jgi:tetratricopeptide (TPR) repeat protein
VRELTEAVGCARESGVVEFEAHSLIHLSHALERVYRLAEARAVAEQAKVLQPENGWIDLVLGMIAGKEKDLAGQRESFERSLRRSRADGSDRRTLAMRHRVIGESFAEAGEYEAAVEAYLEALAGYQEAADEMNIAAILECLGTAYVSDGRLDEAAAVLSQALPLVQAQEQWDCEARIHVALGRRLARLGQIAEAAEAWRQALGIYEYHGAAAADDVRELLA